MLSVSIGAWADKDVEGKYKLTTEGQIWHQGKDDQQTVVKIYLYAPNNLGEALQDLKNQNIDYQMLYISGIGSDPNQMLDLTDSDLEALRNVNVETIDMRNLITASAFTFTNQYVKSVILPSSFGKAEVKAAGLALAQSNNFGSCFSMRKGIYAPHDLDVDGNPITYTEGTINTYAANESGSVIAYVAKPNTLRHAILHSYFNTKNNTILRHQGFDFNNEAAQSLRSFTVMGYPSASDMATQGDWDENGHFVPNCTAYEYSKSANAGGSDGKTTRQSYYDGTNKTGALWGAGLIMFDMSDAVIYEQYNSDMTLTWLGSCCSQLEQVWLPTSSLVKTIPADFAMSDWHYLRQIYIPANIENIKTRAFYGSSRNLAHIWTAGPNENTVYDNGAWVTDGSTDNNPSDDVHFFGMAHLGSLGNPTEAASNKTYGTFTFSPNLKCIESYVFNSDHVKDVYCLGTTAPECHVDAFNATMYIANNDYKTDQITSEGIITREAYTNNVTNRMYMTMLHYPRETVTPDIQRYTDPTRTYSVATGLRDGRGNNIYFPVQTEYLRAYGQGTTGYLWEAWDRTKNDWDYEFKNDPLIVSAHTTTAQQSANEAWRTNPDTEDKIDRSFYDVTLGDGEKSVVSYPTGLKQYYLSEWTENGVTSQLYPQPEIEEGDYIYEEAVDGQYVKDGDTYREWTSADGDVTRYNRATKQGVDENGYLMYEKCDEGELVQDWKFVPAANGDYVWEVVPTVNANGPKVRDYEYVEATNQTAAEGKYYHPLVGAEWNSPKPWYLRTEGWVDCPENECTNVRPQGDANPGWIIDYSTWENWNHNDYPNATFIKKSVTYTIANEGHPLFYVDNSTYSAWNSTATDYVANINGTLYNKVYKDSYRDYNETTDAGETRYDVTDNGFRKYNGTADDAAGYSRYTRELIAHSYRAFDESKDEAGDQRYCPYMIELKEVAHAVQNDYRGWHQFVLTGYATNSKIPFEPVRWFINDNDWWTICVPFDLKYSDMIMFFGTEADKNNGTAKLPYLSKLKYVVRDQKNEKITLTFSKNLMEYKEMIPGSKNAISGTSYNHGFIDDETKWTANELSQDPVILHAGVPYLIKPNMTKENGSFNRQFDIFATTKADLHSRLQKSTTLNGSEQMQMIYKGEYTVARSSIKVKT